MRGCAVCEFAEKPQTDEGWINGGFFVFNPKLFDYLEKTRPFLEQETLARLAKEGSLMAFHHPGFWQPMDMLQEKLLLWTDTVEDMEIERFGATAVFVTGATGLLGSWMTDALADRGAQVTCRVRD